MPNDSYDKVKSILGTLDRRISDARQRRLGANDDRRSVRPRSVNDDAWIGGAPAEPQTSTSPSTDQDTIGKADTPENSASGRPKARPLDGVAEPTSGSPTGVWAPKPRSPHGRAKPLSPSTGNDQNSDSDRDPDWIG